MVGKILRDKREEQRIALEDVESITSIRRSYIEAIEKEDYDKLPGLVYARGFVRNYADFLGLDGDTIAAQFKKEMEPELQAQETPKAVAPAVPVRDESRSVTFSSGKDFKVRTQGTSTMTKVLSAAAVVVVAFAGSIYYYFGNDPADAGKSRPVAQKQDSTVIDVANSTASASGMTDGVEVVAAFSSKCWTWVTSDGKDVFEGFAEKGQRLTWKGKTNVNVALGNAGAVEIIRNGQSLGKAGKNGEVVEIRYTKDKAERVK
ncbi:MAG: helix-turn-helix domain-containing protein [Schwartzia sp.]|nr:helix-turn-helix domain-containing protein [Schwartzia sp. (in: firmicutes)]